MGVGKPDRIAFQPNVCRQSLFHERWNSSGRIIFCGQISAIHKKRDHQECRDRHSGTEPAIHGILDPAGPPTLESRTTAGSHGNPSMAPPSTDTAHCA